MATNLGIAKGFTAALGLTGVIAYFLAGWDLDLLSIVGSPWFWLLAAAFCAAEFFTVEVPLRSQKHSYSMNELPFVLGLFFFDQSGLVLAAVTGAFVEHFFFRKQRGVKLAFNFCLQLTTTVTQLVVFEWVAESRDPMDATAMVGVYAAVVASAILSNSAVNVVISLVEGGWERAIYARGLLFGVLSQVANASLGIIGVLLVDLDWRAIFILLTPVAMMLAAYRSFGARFLAEKLLRESEEQLVQSQKMDAVGQLAGGVAHDFNNLLAIIKNYAEFVHQELPAGSQERSDVEEILKAATGATHLTQQLLSFARKEMVAPTVVDVNEVVIGLHRLLHRTIEESIELKISTEPQLGNVMIDPGQLQQVLINLVVNAKDAMPMGGALLIRTARVHVPTSEARPMLPAGDYATVSVEDSGIGMSPEVADRIFEPFFTTKGKGQGTGLGLATVYGIVQQAGGHIEIDSQVGSGTVMRVYLPVTAETMDGASDETSPASRSGKGTILLAEDSESLRRLVGRMLARKGYEVIAAASGAEAFDLWQEASEKFDLLVTDVVMPKMSGGQLSELTGLRTVFMSGYADEIISHEQISDGAAFVQKPFSEAELLEAVTKMLSAAPREITI